MNNSLILPIAIVVLVVALLIFVRIIRVIVGLLFRIAIGVVATIIAVSAIAILLNNETIYESPGIEARAIHFLTWRTAATSEKGLGSATCTWPDESPSPTPTATPKPTPVAGASPGASPTPSAEDDVYPELMTRGFPGISRRELFDLSQQTVNSFGGWKIVKTDPHTGIIDCIYTSRFGTEDDVRITVTPKSDLQLCARSGYARPDSPSLLRFFPGDFGANIGHIKQFYETVEPQMDAVYQKEQEKENAKKPHGTH